MHIFVTIFATILLQTYLDRIKWPDSRTEDCVVMLSLGNRTGTVRMMSLTKGRLVNRDQFKILPIPLSVIKRMNELALKDGRLKGKGELARPPTTYDMQSNVGSSLPDIIETVTHNGIDPSLMLRSDEDEPNSAINGVPYNEYEGNGGVSDIEMQVNDTDYADDAIPVFIPQGKPKAVDMDDLIQSFGGLGSGRYDDEGIGGMGELYGATTSAAVSGDNTHEPYSSTAAVESSETEDEQHDNSLKPRRENFMQFFRKGVDGGALLTRVYTEQRVDWTDHVFNISVNEALRTRGKNAESVIEKELG